MSAAYIFIPLVSLLAAAIVLALAFVFSSSSTSSEILLYTATFSNGNSPTDPLIWHDQIAYVEVGNKIALTTSFTWAPPIPPLTNTTNPLVFTLPTSGAANVIVAYVSTANITFPSPYNMLLGEQYGNTNTIAFRFSENGATSNLYLTGADISLTQSQILGFVVTYTII